MLTLPSVVERPERPYVAVRRWVTMPFDEQIPGILQELDQAMERNGLVPDGAVFFKHNIIRMPELEMDFGMPLRRPPDRHDGLVAGTLAAGRYAELTYRGHYDNLEEVNAVMVGWGRQKGLKWDSEVHPDGEHFRARLEVYLTDPATEPDPERWETVLAFKLAEDQDRPRSPS